MFYKFNKFNRIQPSKLYTKSRSDSGRMGAHPWEICRGGNSTHISLFVSEVDNKWGIWLAGSSIVRVEETVRMAVALHENNIPFELRDADEILRMVTGNDYIGIVPDKISLVNI